MSTPRVIKKYPNRRLYDTKESRYVTLEDLRCLVTGECDFVVLDRKTGENITRSVLLQIIRDQDGDSVLSEQFLAQVIRCHGCRDPQTLTQQLEGALRRHLSEIHGFSGPDTTNPLTSGPQMP